MVRRSVPQQIQSTNTPTITSAHLPQRRYNKHNQHMLRQLGEVMADVMHGSHQARHQRTGRTVTLNKQFGALTQTQTLTRTTIVTTV